MEVAGKDDCVVKKRRKDQMESNDSGHGDAADRIYDTIEILVVKEKKRRHAHEFLPSIYRVTKTLRDVSPNSYTPRVISIGPFHKDNKILKEAEVHKVAYMFDLYGRLKSPREQTTKACVNMVLNKIDRIRACYAGKMKTYDDHEFAQMMVIDGCFILELIYRSNDRIYESPSVFVNKLLTLYVKHDLVLLENQIPFFVLQDLFECTIRKLEPRASLVSLVLSFLKDVNPFRQKLVLDNDEAETNHDHILGVLQRCYQHAHAKPSENSKTTSNSAAEFLNAISYSVTELAMAGVKFKPNNDTKWLLAMEFKFSRVHCFCWSWGKPTFRMPMLQIEDYTEAVLRNLIAYEQFSPAVPDDVTSYAFAMERILDTKEDVLKVIESKVLTNNLGSSEQASNMINSICKEVTVKDFSYIKQWKQLDGYYNGYWPKNVAWLRRTYFSSPWSFIALLAGFLLFGLTVAQTYFTIRPI
ncbi:putative UPF0481 protein At3g02645 [Cynara cardunculus var. scolymus]|uniref:putative UPF0481 protein At3g02645 n=1 Tax=Cynara cardunculus var. scolymus TaxID=59895 RepID=UPI000D62B4F9|nr:putative UPF0481 protein At3g02645 [Cynara cardunculus var. scolymus]